MNIGDDVLIGEYVSIRDSTHGHDVLSVPIKNQPDIIGSVEIESNVWIGRGSLIQGNRSKLVLGEGSIIGANSVVTRSIPPFEIWGGVPARFIRRRA